MVIMTLFQGVDTGSIPVTRLETLFKVYFEGIEPGRGRETGVSRSGNIKTDGF